MRLRKIIITMLLLILVQPVLGLKAFAKNSKARNFVDLIYVDGIDDRVRLKLDEKDFILKTAERDPVVKLKLDLEHVYRSNKGSEEMRVVLKKLGSEGGSLLSSTNYKVRKRQGKLKFKTKLRNFAGDSGLYEFDIYDTEGTLIARFNQEFLSEDSEGSIANLDDTEIQSTEGELTPLQVRSLFEKYLSVEQGSSRTIPKIIKDKKGHYKLKIPRAGGKFNKTVIKALGEGSTLSSQPSVADTLDNLVRANRVGIGVPVPNAVLHLKAGDNLTPTFMLEKGELLDSILDGAFEFNGDNLFLSVNGERKTLAFTDSSIVGDGASITNINASNISSGIIPDERLSENVVILEKNQILKNKELDGGVLRNVFLLSPNVFGDLTLNSNTRINSSGNIGLGTISPTATLDIKAGTAVANTAPLKFNPGINLATPENGAVEFDGTRLFFTAAGTRETVRFQSDPLVGDGSGLTNLNANNIATGVLAAARGGTGVSNTGTVTLGANNLVVTGGAVTLTQTGVTNVTLPTNGTLATLTNTETFANKSFASTVTPTLDDTYDLGSPAFRWRDVYVGPASLHVGTNGNEATIGYDTVNNRIAFDADGDSTPDFVMTDAGNLGIGSLTPTAKLDIVGNLAVTGTVDGIDVGTDVPANAASITTNTGNIATNFINIAANTTNIASSVTGISTNLTNIGINATAITTKAAIAGQAFTGNITAPNIGVGISPAAALHIKAGTLIAGTAPIKLTSGTNLTILENGAIEYDGTDLFMTIAGSRKTVTFDGDALSGDGSAITNLNASNIASGILADARLSVNVPLLDANNSYSGNAVLGDAATDTLTITSTIQGASPLVLEGSTDDAFETTLALVDPTADRVITLPDATTTLIGADTTDTLTNKTLTSPVVNMPVVTTPTITGLVDINTTAEAIEVGDGTASDAFINFDDGTDRNFGWDDSEGAISTFDNQLRFRNRQGSTPPVACSASVAGMQWFDTDTDMLYICATSNSRNKWLSTQDLVIYGENSGTCDSGSDANNANDCSVDWGSSLGSDGDRMGFYIPHDITVTGYGFSIDGDDCSSGTFDLEIWGTGSNSDPGSFSLDAEIVTGLTDQAHNASNLNVNIAGDQYLMWGIDNNCGEDIADWNLMIYYRWRHD